MRDEFSERYGDLLAGSYDCVDRVVLNAYFSLGHNPGGFRVWWRRLHGGSDELLDNTHLMRMAGRFSRRVRASARAHGIPVIDCQRGERKHQVAEEYLATHKVGPGMFLILVARAAVPVWQVTRSSPSGGVIVNLAKKTAFVNHYSFHVMDPEWGHVTIKMSGHPPFGAQVILDDLPLPTRVDTTRLGGIDLNKPRIRTTLAAVLALSIAPTGFTVKDLATKVHAITGNTGYTTRQAAYDLHKLRGKDLVTKPGRSRRYHVPPPAARTIAALTALREHVIGPLLAGVHSPQRGRKPATWTPIDRDYEALRTDMHTLFHDLGITTPTAAAA